MRLNSVQFIARLTRDPDLRYTPAGKAVCNMSFAINESYLPEGQTEWVDKAVFIEGTAWDKMAERLSESLVKGQEVLVSGKLGYQSWQTDDGQKRSKNVIDIKNVSAGRKAGEKDGTSDDDAEDDIPF